MAYSQAMDDLVLIAKRIMDLMIGSLAAAVCSPVFALVSGAILISMGRPCLFRQQRPGLAGKPFTLLKFRTMVDTRDKNGQLLPDKDRLTRLGRFLRSASLDELPELFNVLRGEMSLVGPRPLLMQYLDRYTPEQMRRHNLPPGITGWAQIHGRNAISWEEKFALDLWYVDNWSIWLDLKILGLTVLSVLKRQGISQPGHATMEEFQGTPHGNSVNRR